MKENYLSYNDIENYFGRDKIQDRFKFLHDKMTEYIKVRGLEEKLFVNLGILQQVVMDYFVDIYRLKEFHKVNKTDMMKILAYESFWVLRRKPLQATQAILEGEYQDQVDDRLVFANEGFVTTLIAHEFLFPNVEEPLSKEEEDAILDMLRQLNYHLKYRSVDKQALEMMILAFKTGRVLD